MTALSLSRRAMLAGMGACGLAPAVRAAPAPAAMRIAPDRELMVPVEGGSLYVRINGALDGPRLPLVYMHGGPGSGHAGLLPLTALADERAVILYDQLDSGRSDAPRDPANWRVSRFVDEIEAIRSALGIDRWHVGGGSWGGTLAIEYGARRPAALASLIVQSPLVSTRSWLADAARRRDELPVQWQATLLACEGAERPASVQCAAADEAYLKTFVVRTDPDPRIRAYRAAAPRDAGRTLYETMWGPTEFRAPGLLHDYDGEALLARLNGQRTLFMAGEFDEARPATVAAFAARAHGAAFREIRGAAHSVLTDQPDAVLALLRPWLARFDRAGTAR